MHHQNFGIAVVEALSQSVPVLISNKIDIWQEIKDNGAGIAAEDTLVGTKQLLEQWMKMDTKEKTVMRANALSSFHNQFSSECLSNNLMQLLPQDGLAAKIV